MKKDRLPLHLQQQLNYKQQPKKDEKQKKDENKEIGMKKADDLNAALTRTDKEAKETILNLKTDY